MLAHADFSPICWTYERVVQYWAMIVNEINPVMDGSLSTPFS